jgi:hypothetical protein
LLEFKTIEYKRKGYAIATDDKLERITNVPKRELMRRGINQHTLEKICARKPVRAVKQGRCIKALDQYQARAITELLRGPEKRLSSDRTPA